jgi:hypothetical protein
MPLPSPTGTSKASREKNIEALTHEIGKSVHVQSPEQAVAIGYSMQRRNKAKKAASKKSKPVRHFGSIAPPDHDSDYR